MLDTAGETAGDARRDLERIRALMERSRVYRHPPASAAAVAGALALVAGWLTDEWLAGAREELVNVAALWGATFGLSLAVAVLFTWRETRREGTPLLSPLAKDVLHALWPSFVTGVALTVALARSGSPEALGLVPGTWMLCYATGAIAAGAYLRKAVRRLGAAFLAAGLLALLVPFPPGVALAATFGLFHLVYALAVARRSDRSSS
jgi:hypothetical protein